MGRLIKALIILLIAVICAGVFFYYMALKPAGNNAGIGNNGIGANFGKTFGSAREFISRNSGKIFFRFENKLLDEEEPGKKYRRIQFRYDDPNAVTVCISGEFNDWADEPMEKKNSGIWEKTKPLLPDVEYTYSFIVDGVSVPDPSNPNIIDLGIRGKASIVPAGTEDIHALAARTQTKPENAAGEETLLDEKIIVSGIVCEKDGRAVPGAIIKISQAGNEMERTKTGKDGTFPELKLDRGQYVFKAWKDKYNARSITVELGNAPHKRLKFTLTRQ